MHLHLPLRGVCSHIITTLLHRCQESTSRVELKVYCPEGASGVLRALVLPTLSIETCPMLTRSLKPLSLHARVEQPSVQQPKLPTNRIRITGDFAALEMHGWLCNVLPDVPAQPPGGGSMVLHYTNTLLGCQLTWWVVWDRSAISNKRIQHRTYNTHTQ